MSNNDQSSKQVQTRSWSALWSVLVLAPLAMAPKGCDGVVIGDNCPSTMPCTAGAAGSAPTSSAGAAGSKPTGTGGGSAGSKPTGSAGSNPGGDKVCGGFIGATCAADEYCLFDVKAACGATDQTGVCTPRPQVCTEIYAPVCGCDNVTYSSDCVAAGKGVSVQHTGECEDPSTGRSCGGLQPATCAKSEFCNFPIDAACGAADQTGVCTKIPDACDQVYSPVCGCDGVTYSNECTAAAKGVSVQHSGTCEATNPGQTCGGLLGTTCPTGLVCLFTLEAKCGSGDQTGTCTAINDGACPANVDPVCGCNGKTYSNACIANSSGISVASKGACPTTCGGDLNVACAADEYCNYSLSANCGRADAGGVCAKKLTGACTAQYDPVCGCDGKTYGNDCEAGRAGVAISSKGACP